MVVAFVNSIVAAGIHFFFLIQEEWRESKGFKRDAQSTSDLTVPLKLEVKKVTITVPEESAKGKNTADSMREEVSEIQTCSKAAKNVQKGGNDKGNKRKDKTIILAELNGENYDDVETDLSEVCDSEFEVENEDDDGIWKNVNVNDLSGLDGRDIIGTETRKSKIDNKERVEEHYYAETHVEDDGAVQEGSESNEGHRLVNEEFQLFEGENIEVSDLDNACDSESLNEF
ncbi:hypothetical protein M9H77_24114 [Catharanthus roseus]|uniref:Uncharacterized protein n=1 Tax=Catharanthus roseus TaxID=4058 RepID=A0ACC0AW64_CATRO|nr:hypothetical protein M9H77_24114 [Catharanthus roseus]